MPRTARLIDVKRPYHICQRGNSRQRIFCDDDDREYFLEIVKESSSKYEMKVLAYCLMENHVHLVVIPEKEKSLARSFRNINGIYSNYFNRKYDKSGHLWSERYYSKVLDSRHLAIAVRYVERNPVRAGLVENAADWKWSTAEFHVNAKKSKITLDDFFKYTEITPRQWKEFIARPEYNNELNIVR